MFDISLFELCIVAAIALLVLGPERLPYAVQQAGRWIGRAKRMASHWSSEINRQIDNEELAKEFKKNKVLNELNKQIEPVNKAFSQSLSGQALGKAVAEPIREENAAKNDVPDVVKKATASS